MLTDTGPLVAIIDAGDSAHQRCMEVLATLPPAPLLTTWPCFTETMYLLESVGGYRFQEPLWHWRQNGRLLILDIDGLATDRMRMLMAQYQDVPMDLADASLIAIAEQRHFHQVFTLDSDCYIFRLQDGTTLDIVR